MNGADIDYLLAACVSDPLVGEGNYAQYDQSDPHKRCWINARRIYSFVTKPKWLIHLIAPNAARYCGMRLTPSAPSALNQYDLNRPAKHRVGSEKADDAHH